MSAVYWNGEQKQNIQFPSCTQATAQGLRLNMSECSNWSDCWMVRQCWKPTQPSSTYFNIRIQRVASEHFLLSKINNPILTPTLHQYWWGVQMWERKQAFDHISNAFFYILYVNYFVTCRIYNQVKQKDVFQEICLLLFPVKLLLWLSFYSTVWTFTEALNTWPADVLNVS